MRKTTVTPRKYVFHQLKLADGRHGQGVVGEKWQHSCVNISGRNMQKFEPLPSLPSEIISSSSTNSHGETLR